MQNKKSSLMLKETFDIAMQVNRVINSELPKLPIRPNRIYTVGRGSSDHAALVIHHLFSRAGIPSSTLPISLANEVLDTCDSLYLVISQSGASPDLCEAANRIKHAGCTVMSLVNHEHSRLSEEATVSLLQYAGDEISVAATKSVICSILTGAKLAEHWGATSMDLSNFSKQVEVVQKLPIQKLKDLFMNTGPIVIIGRGSGWGIACEIALKLQELLGRPAMAYSSSEVLHGPAGMFHPGYPILALAVGPERADVLACVKKLEAIGTHCHVIDQPPRDDALAATLSLCHMYIALEASCRDMGLSPDNPKNLSKITLT